MRKSALPAITGLFAVGLLVTTPATADIVELHIGQTDFANADANYPDSTEGEGKTYRLMATNYVEQNAYLRLEARRDSLDLANGGVDLTASDRQVLLFGLGERWGSSTVNYGMEIGGAQITLEQEFSGFGGVENEEVTPYLGMDLHGRAGDFEWKLDATYYNKVPLFARYESTPLFYAFTPREPDSEVWTGGQLVWNFSDGPALGFRYEVSGEIEAATIFMRFEM